MTLIERIRKRLTEMQSSKSNISPYDYQHLVWSQHQTLLKSLEQAIDELEGYLHFSATRERIEQIADILDPQEGGVE